MLLHNFDQIDAQAKENGYLLPGVPNSGRYHVFPFFGDFGVKEVQYHVKWRPSRFEPERESVITEKVLVDPSEYAHKRWRVADNPDHLQGLVNLIGGPDAPYLGTMKRDHWYQSPVSWHVNFGLMYQRGAIHKEGSSIGLSDYIGNLDACRDGFTEGGVFLTEISPQDVHLQEPSLLVLDQSVLGSQPGHFDRALLILYPCTQMGPHQVLQREE